MVMQAGPNAPDALLARRRFLAAMAVPGLAKLAGCGGGDDDNLRALTAEEMSLAATPTDLNAITAAYVINGGGHNYRFNTIQTDDGWRLGTVFRLKGAGLNMVNPGGDQDCYYDGTSVLPAFGIEYSDGSHFRVEQLENATIVRFYTSAGVYLGALGAALWNGRWVGGTLTSETSRDPATWLNRSDITDPVQGALQLFQARMAPALSTERRAALGLPRERALDTPTLDGLTQLAGNLTLSDVAKGFAIFVVASLVASLLFPTIGALGAIVVGVAAGGLYLLGTAVGVEWKDVREKIQNFGSDYLGPVKTQALGTSRMGLTYNIQVNDSNDCGDSEGVTNHSGTVFPSNGSEFVKPGVVEIEGFLVATPGTITSSRQIPEDGGTTSTRATTTVTTGGVLTATARYSWSGPDERGCAGGFTASGTITPMAWDPAHSKLNETPNLSNTHLIPIFQSPPA